MKILVLLFNVEMASLTDKYKAVQDRANMVKKSAFALCLSMFSGLLLNLLERMACLMVYDLLL